MQTVLVTAWHALTSSTAPPTHAEYAAHAANCRALADHYDQWSQQMQAQHSYVLLLRIAPRRPVNLKKKL